MGPVLGRGCSTATDACSAAADKTRRSEEGGVCAAEAGSGLWLLGTLVSPLLLPSFWGDKTARL